MAHRYATGVPRQAKKAARKFSRLYETDETAWLEQMASLIKQGRYDDIDYGNLRGFLLDMARRDKREVVSRLTTLLTHLVKWDHQPRKRSRSWRGTIISQTQELQDLLESRTLRNYAAESLAKAYAKALKRAVAETGLADLKFPRECPYSLENVLSKESF